MQINFNAFRLKFFLLGMVIVFFIVGLSKKLFPVLKKALMVAVLSVLLYSCAYSADLLEPCVEPFHGCYTTYEMWNLGGCRDVCENTVGKHPCLVGPHTCGVGYAIDNGNYIGCDVFAGGCVSGGGGCTGSAGSGVWDHFEGICTSTDPEVDCRSGVCVPCSSSCQSAGGGCNQANVCIPCPSYCLAGGSSCSKQRGICDKKCVSPYTYNAADNICVGPKGERGGPGEGLHFRSSYGKERRIRFFGRGGYEIKN